MSGQDYMAALRSKILAEVTGKSTSKSLENTSDGQKNSEPLPHERKEDKVARNTGVIVTGEIGQNNVKSVQENSGRPQRASPSPSRSSRNNNHSITDTRRGPSHADYANQRKQDSRRGPAPPVNQHTSRYGKSPRPDNRERQSRFQRNDSSVSKPAFNSGNSFQQNRGQESCNGRFDNKNRWSDASNASHSRNTNFQVKNNQADDSEGHNFRKSTEWKKDLSHNSRGRFEPNKRRFGHAQAERYKTKSPNPSASWSSEDPVINENATGRSVIPPYETILKNITNVRLNRTLIVTPMIPGFEEHVSVVAIIKEFIGNVDYDLETKNEVSSSIIEKNRIVMEFNKESLVTIVLTCQKYLESKICSQFIWSRPNGCVNDTGNVQPINHGSVLSLLKLGPECEDEESTKQWLIDEQVEYSWLQLMKLKGSDERTSWIKALLYEPKAEDQKKLPMTIRPNQSSMQQNFKSITYENFPHLVKKYEKKPSKVVCVLNSVDPMDLKNENFVTEIKEAMMYGTPIQSCGEVESVQIPLPNPDYRNDMNHIHSSIGKVFIKFRDLVGAEKAMLVLPGSQFCQRTILCSYYSETDYDMGIL
ncbi:Mud2 [Kluyveromyces lactis]|nr:Mud2 [Kluyveromyces lactis]